MFFKRAIASDTRFIIRLADAGKISHKSPHVIRNVPVVNKSCIPVGKALFSRPVTLETRP